jgi:hypothetical protein
MNWFVFLYNFLKTEERLLSVMIIWSARIRDPAVWILTVKYILRIVLLSLGTHVVNDAILFTVVRQIRKGVPVL